MRGGVSPLTLQESVLLMELRGSFLSIYATGHGSEKFIHLFDFVIIGFLFKYEWFFHCNLIFSRRKNPSF